jgi:hypothetical protein
VSRLAEKILDFKVINEPWNKYFNENHGTLRARLVIIRLILDDESKPNVRIGFKSQNLFDMIVNPENKGPPDSTSYTSTELSQSIVEKDIPFKTVEEDWNVYKAEGKEVRFKQLLVKVDKTSKFDSVGDPIYIINSQQIVKMV